MVVYSFFNKHDRKPRNRSGRKSKYRMFNDTITERFTELLLAYKDQSFSTKIRTFVLGLPRRKLGVVLQITTECLLQDKITGRIAVMIRDLVNFRQPSKNVGQLKKTESS